MHAFEIVLHTTAEIRTFVNLTNRYPCTILLRQGRAVTDAKSILGIYSLDLTKPMTVEVYSDHTEDFIAQLEPFAA